MDEKSESVYVDPVAVVGLPVKDVVDVVAVLGLEVENANEDATLDISAAPGFNELLLKLNPLLNPVA